MNKATRPNMQLPNAPITEKFPTIVAAIQHERLMRYAQPASGSMDRAFAFYTWNGTLCESFHVTLHYAEIVTRNALNRALTSRFDAEWFDNATLHAVSEGRFAADLQEAVSKERAQHGDKMTAHHVTSALTFGFWEHLVTKRFERLLWARGVQHVLPSAPKEVSRQLVHDRIESVRRWRNRIAHHRAIFDKGPTRKHQETLELIGWACTDTRDWVAAASRVPVAIALRPK